MCYFQFTSYIRWYILLYKFWDIFFFFFFFFQFEACSRYQIIIFLLIIFEFKIKDFGDNFLHHGKINFYVLIALLFLDYIAVLVIVFIYKTMKKKCIFFKILVVLIFLLFYLIYYQFKDKYYCKDWDKGLNNTYINNNITKYPCSINIPKRKCLIDIFSPFLDFSILFNKKCEKRIEKEKFLKLILFSL